MSELVIVIPSLEPDDRIVTLVENIRQNFGNIYPILVINDGSGESFNHYFESLENNFGCTVLKHHINLGKGRALKTAINHILNVYPDASGMVTIDSDGQHKVEDMKKCIDAFNEKPNTMILGVRDFVNNVPLKSRFGNVITRNVLGILIGIKLQDTQTGLRIIPVRFMEALMVLKGERFEFEMNMIIASPENKIKIEEILIETIYFEGNKSTHFRALADSASIYATFMKYLFSSFSSSVIDVVSFSVLLGVLTFSSEFNIIVASFGGRLISSIYNYFINQKVVFKTSSKYSLLKYYILVFVQISISSLLVIVSSTLFKNFDTTVLKVLIDILLFFASFHVQRRYVFKEVW